MNSKTQIEQTLDYESYVLGRKALMFIEKLCTSLANKQLN